MKPIKAWAIVKKDGKIKKGLTIHYIYTSKNWAKPNLCEGERIGRVEIREVKK